MFAKGSKEPNLRTKLLLERLAPTLKARTYRLALVGHTAAAGIPARLGYGPWELSERTAVLAQTRASPPAKFS